MASAEVKGRRASVLVTFGLMILTCVNRMRRVTRCSEVPHVLGELVETWNQSPSKDGDKSLNGYTTHL